MSALATATDTGLRAQTLNAFIDLLENFNEACLEVWPECSALREMKLAFDLAVRQGLTEDLRTAAKEKLIKDYHTAMLPYYDRCSAKDPTVFTEAQIDFLETVNMRSKWLDQGPGAIDEETRECIWEFVLNLNKFANMYEGLFQKIPTNALDRIQNTAMNIAAQINSGELSMQNLNMMEIGQNVVNDMDEEELASFTNDLLANPAALQSLCQSMLGTTDMSQVPAATTAALAAMQMMQMNNNNNS